MAREPAARPAMEAAVLSTDRREKPLRPDVVDVFAMSLSLLWSCLHAE